MRSPCGISITTVGVKRVGKPKVLEVAGSNPTLKTEDDVPLGS